MRSVFGIILKLAVAIGFPSIAFMDISRTNPKFDINNNPSVDALLVFIVVIFIYVLWLLIITIINIVSKSQVQKYSEFVDDLQTIIYIGEYALETQNDNIEGN